MNNLEGPYHDFLILPDTVPYKRYEDYYKSEDKLKVSDDLIGYFWDTFNWIPTINPIENYKQQYGIERWGPTIIDKVGAQVAYNIISAWVKIIQEGTPIIELKGPYTPESGYKKLIIDREEIIMILKKLSSYAKKTMNGDHYILHFGV